tara:strand:- start:212 stop:643 length:432 start_codon:yes stop_codon:yes gene_type:complete
MEISDEIKIAAYKQASLIGGAITGSIGEDGALAGMGNELADSAAGGLAGAGVGGLIGAGVGAAMGPERMGNALAKKTMFEGNKRVNPLIEYMGKSRRRAALLGALGLGITGLGAGVAAGSMNANLQNLGFDRTLEDEASSYFS